MKMRIRHLNTSNTLFRYTLASLLPAVILLLALPLRPVTSVSDIMLLGVACVTFLGFRFGKGEAITASFVSVLLVDVLYVDPYYTLAVHNFDYLVSFCVMLAVGVFIAQLAQRNRSEFARAHQLLLQLKLSYRVARGLSRHSDWAKQVEVTRTALHKGLAGSIDIGLLQALDTERDTSRTLVTHGKVYIKAPLVQSRQNIRTLGLSARMLNQSYENHLVQSERQSAERFKDREVIRANLLRSIGHDLRTPLGTVMGASSMMMDDQVILTTEQMREQAANIYQQSLILKNQIDKMLELSRIRDLATTNDWSQIPTHDLISAAFARTKGQASDQFQIDAQVHNIKGDGALLEIAIANLIDNAIYHGAPRYCLEVKELREASEVRYLIAVSNQVVTPSKKRPDSGTGLGLLICDAIAKLHDGEFCYAQTEGLVRAELMWGKQ